MRKIIFKKYGIEATLEDNYEWKSDDELIAIYLNDMMETIDVGPEYGEPLARVLWETVRILKEYGAKIKVIDTAVYETDETEVRY